MIKNYFMRHAQVFFFSLGQLSRTPIATFLTVAVIGITLALPACLYVAIENLQRLSGSWDAFTSRSKTCSGSPEAGTATVKFRCS